MLDSVTLLRALQDIRSGDDCQCNGGPDCCIEAGEFCAHCVADRAINAYLGLIHHQKETVDA